MTCKYQNQIYYNIETTPVFVNDQHGGIAAPCHLTCCGENMSAITCDFPAGYTFKKHAHPHEQLTIVLSGHIRYTAGDETHDLGPGDTMYVPSNTMHTAVALDNCRSMDVFTPARMDQMAWFDDALDPGCAFTEEKK